VDSSIDVAPSVLIQIRS